MLQFGNQQLSQAVFWIRPLNLKVTFLSAQYIRFLWTWWFWFLFHLLVFQIIMSTPLTKFNLQKLKSLRRRLEDKSVDIKAPLGLLCWLESNIKGRSWIPRGSVCAATHSEVSLHCAAVINQRQPKMLKDHFLYRFLYSTIYLRIVVMNNEIVAVIIAVLLWALQTIVLCFVSDKTINTLICYSWITLTVFQ